ncbi:MAG: TerB family tellurite resistance protein [Myxococcota bacterium]
MKVRDRIDVLIPLFLGAVHADERLEPSEAKALENLLADLLLQPELPASVRAQIDAFDPGSFDLREAAAAFAEDPPMRKRRLLELVGRMCHADGVLDFEEDAYMRTLAEALEMKPEEYQDLVLDYDIEELRESFVEIRRPPPPPPRAKP